MCQSTPMVLPAHRSTPIAYLTGDCVYTVSLTPTNTLRRSRRQALCITTFGRVFASTNNDDAVCGAWWTSISQMPSSQNSRQPSSCKTVPNLGTCHGARWCRLTTSMRYSRICSPRSSSMACAYSSPRCRRKSSIRLMTARVPPPVWELRVLSIAGRFPHLPHSGS